MILYIFSFLELFGFIIYATPVVLGAYSLACYLSKGGWSEVITLSFCISFLEVIAIFAILGFSGLLNAPCGFVLNFIVEGLLYYVFQKKTKLSAPSIPLLNLEERILVIIFFTGMLFRLYATSIHSGTDTYLYHLFYPATWITDGYISKITIIGLTRLCRHEIFAQTARQRICTAAKNEAVLFA